MPRLDVVDCTGMEEPLVSPNGVEEVHDIANLLVSLRELLTNAFDDLIDDDTSSNSSQDSQDSGTHSGEKILASQATWQRTNKWATEAIPGYTSTPIGLPLPPLQSPTRLHYPGFGQTFPVHPAYQFAPFNYPGYLPPSQLSPEAVHGFTAAYKNEQLLPVHAREETEGGNEIPSDTSMGDDETKTDNIPNKHRYPDPSQFSISDSEEDSMHSKAGNSTHTPLSEYPVSNSKINSEPKSTYHKSCEPSQYPLTESTANNSGHTPMDAIDNGACNYGDSHRDTRNNFVAYPINDQGDHYQEYSPKKLQHYQVEYKRGQLQDSTDAVSKKEAVVECPEETQNIQHHLQQQYLDQGGTAQDRQVVQLQILYQACGRQLEEVQHELAEVKESTAREMRVLKHQLALAEGEKDGIAGSLQQSGNLIQSVQQENADLHHKVSSLESQVADLLSSKDEVVRNLQAAENTIENLNQQLFELRNSESITRAREQHDSVTANLKQKYDHELYSLKEKIDEVHQKLEEKADETSSLRLQLSSSIKSAEQSQIDRADTINRLTRSLEESQRQCRDLLESGATLELGQMKVQLQQAIASKCISEDLCKTLQTEITELKEQVSYYESASQLGVLANSSADTSDKTEGVLPSDSFVHLNIRQSNDGASAWKTPNIRQSSKTSLSPEEVMPKLKTEMQRILLNNKTKREQVTKLQNELKNTKQDLNDWKQKFEKMTGVNKEQQEKLVILERECDLLKPDNSGLSATEKRLKKETESLRRESEALHQELEEVKQKLSEVATSEEHVTEINAELRQQMAQMVKDYDEDKQLAVEKCQEACLNHHEQSKENLRKEMADTYETEKEQLVSKYEKQIQNLRDELKEMHSELDRVKELYIATCHEKDQMEDLTKEQFEKQLASAVLEMKTKLKAEKNEELEQLKEMETCNITDLKEKRLKNQEQEIKRRVESQVAMAKIDWFEEQKRTKKDAVDQAVKTKVQELKLEYETKLESEVQAEIQKAKSEWQTNKRLSFETELNQRLSREKDKWQVTSDQTNELTVKEAVSEAKTQWLNSLQEQKVNWKKEWECEAEKTLNEVKNVMQKEILKLKEEIQSLTVEKDIKETELKNSKNAWQREKDILTCEKNDTGEELNNWNKQLQDIKMRYETLEKEKKHVVDKLEEKENTLSNIEAEWRQKLVHLEEQKDAEYEKFLKDHQNTLNDALKSKTEQLETQAKQHEEGIKTLNEKLEFKLKQADIEWQTKLERLQNSKSCQNSPEQTSSDSWSAEKSKLLKEIEHRDELLQSTDKHLEQEIEKLRIELEKTHAQHLQEELTKTRRESLTSEEKQAYLTKLNNAQKQVKSLENTYDHQIVSLQEKLSQREKELSEQQTRFEERLQNCKVENAKNNVTFDCEKQQLYEQLQKSENRKEELKLLYSKSEVEHEQIIANYKRRNEDLNHRLQRLEQRHETEMDKVHEESKVAMQTMKEKMMELRQEHDGIIEGIKRDHNTEKLVLEKRLAEIQKEFETKETQTERSEVRISAVDKVKQKYVETVKQIKAEVMKHVSETNSRAAQRVKEETTKARHDTGKQLRKYYLQCLNDILSDPHSLDKAVQMTRMETVLELRPDSQPLSVGSIVSSSTSFVPVDRVGEIFPDRLNEVQLSYNHPQSSARESSYNAGDVIQNYGSGTQNLETVNFASKLQGYLNEAKSRTEPVPKYKYTSLRDTFTKRGRDDISVSTINVVDAGLHRLPQQPRQYNPPPEKLSSTESSQASSPINTGLSKMEKLNRKENYQGAKLGFVNSIKTVHNKSPRRQPMKALPTEDVQKMLANVPTDISKPVPMVTRQTQAPSPHIYKEKYDNK